MCHALYLGTDESLSTVHTADAEGPFFVRELESKYDRQVIDKFSKPHVYYAASWQGCGCGWYPETRPFALTAQRREAIRVETHARCIESIQALRDLLGQLLTDHESIELYMSWEGEQAQPPNKRLDLQVVDFEAGAMPLKRGDFATVTRTQLTSAST